MTKTTNNTTSNKANQGEALKVCKMGMDCPQGLGTYRARVCITTKAGERVTLDIGGYDRQVWRSTNKRTGAPLKKAVIDHVEPNKLHADIYHHKIEIWPNTSGDGVYDACYGASDAEYEQMKKYNYTVPEVLEYINELTGRNYNRVEFVNHTEELKPAEWERIKAQEIAEATNETTEQLTRKAGELVRDILNSGRDVPEWCYKSRNEAERLSGITEEEKRQALRIIDKVGGTRERFFKDAPHRAIIKHKTTSADHQPIYIYNIVPDSCGVLHYCIVDIKTGMICG